MVEIDTHQFDQFRKLNTTAPPSENHSTAFHAVFFPFMALVIGALIQVTSSLILPSALPRLTQCPILQPALFISKDEAPAVHSYGPSKRCETTAFIMPPRMIQSRLRFPQILVFGLVFSHICYWLISNDMMDKNNFLVIRCVEMREYLLIKASVHIVLSSTHYEPHQHLCTRTHTLISMEMWANIDGHLLVYTFLPALLFGKLTEQSI